VVRECDEVDQINIGGHLKFESGRSALVKYFCFQFLRFHREGCNSGSRLSGSGGFLLKFDDNLLNNFLTNIEIVHNVNNLWDWHCEDNRSYNSRGEFRVDGHNLRIDLVSKVLALGLFITKLSKVFQGNQSGSRLLRHNRHRGLRHLRCLDHRLRDGWCAHWRSLHVTKCSSSWEITLVQRGLRLLLGLLSVILLSGVLLAGVLTLLVGIGLLVLPGVLLILLLLLRSGGPLVVVLVVFTIILLTTSRLELPLILRRMILPVLTTSALTRRIWTSVHLLLLITVTLRTAPRVVSSVIVRWGSLPVRMRVRTGLGSPLAQGRYNLFH